MNLRTIIIPTQLAYSFGSLKQKGKSHVFNDTGQNKSLKFTPVMINIQRLHIYLNPKSDLII